MLLALSTLYAQKLLSLLRIDVLYHAAKAAKRPSIGIFRPLSATGGGPDHPVTQCCKRKAEGALLPSRLSRQQMLRRALRRCAAGNRYRQLRGNRIRHARLHKVAQSVHGLVNQLLEDDPRG